MIKEKKEFHRERSAVEREIAQRGYHLPKSAAEGNEMRLASQAKERGKRLQVPTEFLLKPVLPKNMPTT